jgi:hypothetical protein
MTFTRQKQSFAFELLSVIVLFSLYLLITVFFGDFEFLDRAGTPRSIPSLIGFLPILCIFYLSRIALARWYSVALISIFLFGLVYINKIKHGLTNQPLTWNELSAIKNYSVLPEYAEFHQLSIALAMVLFMSWLIYKTRPFRRPNIWALGAFLVLFPFAFHPLLLKSSSSIGHHVKHWPHTLGVPYTNWDLAANVRQNGLPLHLIQTSARSLPPRPNERDILLYEELSTHVFPFSYRRPKTIVWIMCEACWHNDTHFIEDFNAFKPMGFSHFESIAPGYGGGTVNASFELLTGLPSAGVLDGVIYQEYESLLKQDLDSYVQSLRDAGYATVAMHNHRAEFWNRHLIKPRMGFDQFLARDKMPAGGSHGGWSRDYVLYRTALDWLSNADEEYRFLFLVGVFPHGGYVQRHDYGASSYRDKLRLATEDLAEFAETVIEEHPDALIFFVGDHKPSLTRFFHINGVFNDDLFTKTGARDWHYRFAPNADQSVIGSVPAYIYHNDEHRVRSFIEMAEGLPFYCIPKAFNRIFTGTPNAVLSYAMKNDRCSRENNGKPLYPGFLYRLALFDTLHRQPSEAGRF